MGFSVAHIFLVLLILFVAWSDCKEGRADLYEWVRHPKEWTCVGSADPSVIHTLTIGLHHANRARLEELFWQVSTPSSPRYRRFLSFGEIELLSEPRPAEKASVTNWLRSVPDVTFSIRGEVFHVSAPVRSVEALFDTKMGLFTHKTSGKSIIRHLGKTTVPRAVREAILNQSPLSLWILNDIAATGVKVVANSSNGIFAQFEVDGAPSGQDLGNFDQATAVPQQRFRYRGPMDGNVGGQATVDTQMLTSVALNANTTFFMQEAWMYTFATTLMSLGQDSPLVISISYGWDETDQCSIWLYSTKECQSNGWSSRAYVNATDTQWMKLGLAGRSILVSARDSGAPGPTNSDCSLDSKLALYPVYPASSPYVTTVGATALLGSGPNTNSSLTSHVLSGVELRSPIPGSGALCKHFNCTSSPIAQIAMDLNNSAVTTGGGFSQIEPMPSYQTAAVQAYLKSGVALPPAAKFNASGRAYPDISAIGQNLMILYNTNWMVTAGTAGSTPVAAGIFTLLNDYLLQNKKAPLGFLNPLLYSMAKTQPSSFHQITIGANKCTDQFCCEYGFECNPAGGWSPVTGLGTPSYANILKYLQANL